MVSGAKSTMSTPGRRHWPRASQERAVERFYQPGVERYADYHGGMLNFGLWTDGVRDYRTASRKLIRRAATSIGLKAESRLLDVACGMGAQDVYLAQELGCRSIDGLDVTWKHVLAGRKRACDAGLEDRVRFHHGTAVDLPFADSSFTHVLCVEGAEHFDTRERFLHEVVRVVVPSGRIALTDFSMKRRPRTLVERLLAELGRFGWHVPKENIDTTDGFRTKIERAGFTDVRIEEAGEQVIPGYYEEGRKPQNVRALYAIRGLLATQVGLWIDALVYHLYRRGLLEYVFVSAHKR
jgi:ubiquinone/menaquinone biosynthesis C-methylase UbiE